MSNQAEDINIAVNQSEQQTVQQQSEANKGKKISILGVIWTVVCTLVCVPCFQILSNIYKSGVLNNENVKWSPLQYILFGLMHCFMLYGGYRVLKTLASFVKLFEVQPNNESINENLEIEKFEAELRKKLTAFDNLDLDTRVKEKVKILREEPIKNEYKLKLEQLKNKQFKDGCSFLIAILSFALALSIKLGLSAFFMTIFIGLIISFIYDKKKDKEIAKIEKIIGLIKKIGSDSNIQIKFLTNEEALIFRRLESQRLEEERKRREEEIERQRYIEENTSETSRCKYCGSEWYGKGCPHSPDGIHVHVPIEEKIVEKIVYKEAPKQRYKTICKFCGRSTFGGGHCSSSPHGRHELISVPD